MPQPRCFFDIAINSVPSGRIVFELFSDICPKTCENFRCLCTGERGEGKTTFKPLHYKGTPIHRVVKGFIIQGGDFSTGDGKGGESIYGGMFKDENFQLKHEQPFLLSMANKGPHTNGSQFFITTRPAPHLDGIHVVFGHVLDGKQYVVEMENQKVDTNHRPYADVRITNCGELVLRKADKKGKTKKKVVVSSSSESSEEDSSSEGASSSSSGSSSSESEREEKRRKRKKRGGGEREAKKAKRTGKQKKKKTHSKTKRKKKQKKRSKKPAARGSDSESEETSDSEGAREMAPAEQEEVTSTIPDSLQPPPVPTNSWLLRRSRTPSPREGEEKKSKPRQGFEARPEEKVSRSGRKLKGRGIMRYHTPPRFDDEDEGGGASWRAGGYRRGLDRRGSFSPPPRYGYRRRSSISPQPPADDLRSNLRGGRRRGGGGGYQATTTKEDAVTTRRSRSPHETLSSERKHSGREIEVKRDEPGRKNRWDDVEGKDRSSQVDNSFNQRQVEVMSREEVRQRNYHNRYDHNRGGGRRKDLPQQPSTSEQRHLEEPSSTYRGREGRRHDHRSRSRSRSPAVRRRSSTDHYHRGDKERRDSRRQDEGGRRERSRRSSHSHSPHSASAVRGGVRRPSGGSGGAAPPRGGETKWSRHRSHGSSSSDEEDHALERAYQRQPTTSASATAVGGGSGGGGEDIFGINKLF